MNTVNFESFLQNKNWFVATPAPGNPYIEIWPNGNDVAIREGHVLDRDVESWINQTV